MTMDELLQSLKALLKSEKQCLVKYGQKLEVTGKVVALTARTVHVAAGRQGEYGIPLDMVRSVELADG